MIGEGRDNPFANYLKKEAKIIVVGGNRIVEEEKSKIKKEMEIIIKDKKITKKEPGLSLLL